MKLIKVRATFVAEYMITVEDDNDELLSDTLMEGIVISKQFDNGWSEAVPFHATGFETVPYGSTEGVPDAYLPGSPDDES